MTRYSIQVSDDPLRLNWSGVSTRKVRVREARRVRIYEGRGRFGYMRGEECSDIRVGLAVTLLNCHELKGASD